MYVFLFKCVRVCVEVWSLLYGFTVRLEGNLRHGPPLLPSLRQSLFVILLLSMPG